MGHVSRVESHETSIGIPDVYITLMGGIRHWIELKFSKGRRVILRPSQIMWFRQQRRVGYRPIILTKVIAEGKTYYMYHRSHIPDTDVLQDWENTADHVWDDRINYAELEDLLRHEEEPRKT
jgi:hypothetical protein